MADLITDPAELIDVIRDASRADRYAIDTEFHRERTYYPQVALIQLAWEREVVLIDPLALDLHPLSELLDGPGLCVFHAGLQDLEVLDLATGTVPTRMYDTQIAAGFLGISSGSLASLLDTFMQVTVQKGDRLTDWLQRPLTADQLRYAAGDVDNLLELTDILNERLAAQGRIAWAEEESELQRLKHRNRRPPEDAVQRIKEARSLKGKAARVARAVAEWRERRAAALDLPVRQVLPDLAVVAVAQRAPTSVSELESLRGLDRRHTRNGAAEEILTAVQAGLRAPADAPPPARQPELPRELRPVVTLVTSWIGQLARDNKLDPSLLATRADVESILRQERSGRLTTGWRAELVGMPIQQLVDGEAALAFDEGRLVLEARSHTSIAIQRN